MNARLNLPTVRRRAEGGGEEIGSNAGIAELEIDRLATCFPCASAGEKRDMEHAMSQPVYIP